MPSLSQQSSDDSRSSGRGWKRVPRCLSRRFLHPACSVTAVHTWLPCCAKHTCQVCQGFFCPAVDTAVDVHGWLQAHALSISCVFSSCPCCHSCAAPNPHGALDPAFPQASQPLSSDSRAPVTCSWVSMGWVCQRCREIFCPRLQLSSWHLGRHVLGCF